jgi:hypothetical protein
MADMDHRNGVCVRLSSPSAATTGQATARDDAGAAARAIRPPMPRGERP